MQGETATEAKKKRIAHALLILSQQKEWDYKTALGVLAINLGTTIAKTNEYLDTLRMVGSIEISEGKIRVVMAQKKEGIV